MKTKIYVLLSPEGVIRYVGKTKNSLSSRFMGHLHEARKGERGHRCYWIRSLLSKGKLPSIQLVGEVEGDGCKEEIAWISYFKAEGTALTNNTLGGDGAKRDFTSSETRQKISQTLTGHKLSEVTKEKISATLKINPVRYWKGKKRSPETCHKISLGQIGKKVTDETKCKMSLSHKGFLHTKEAKNKMSEARRGKPLSIEHRKSISMGKKGCVAWNKGKPRFKEAIEKTRLKNTGRKYSAEVRAKVSLAIKEWWRKRKAT